MVQQRASRDIQLEHFTPPPTVIPFNTWDVSNKPIAKAFGSSFVWLSDGSLL
jgi:hypothetical protein